MNRLSTEKRSRVVAALIDGAGINATTRMTNVSKPTVLKLLVDLGAACAAYQDRTIRNKTLRVTPAMQAGLSDHVWSLTEIVGLLDSAEAREAA